MGNINLSLFKGKVLGLVSDANIISEHFGESRAHAVEVFLSSIDYVVEFFNDDLNIEVLNKRNKVGDFKMAQTPLDVLACELLDGLEEVDLLLRDGILDAFLNVCKQSNMSVTPFPDTEELDMATEAIQNEALYNKIKAFETLKYLDGHNKSLIILGPNGSGKTSFANYMKGLDPHIRVISVPHLNDIQHGNLQLIKSICSEYNDIARQFYETNTKRQETKFERIKRVFDEFFDIKLDTSAFSDNTIKAKNEQGRIFGIDSMSDGERVAFFYIANVIDASQQSFVIVDEPENYLNPAIYNKIWDRLIGERPDCQFVFITHNIDFVSARSNYEIATIKKFVYPKDFKFDFLGSDLDDIEPNLIIKLLGSRKPILFCEGKGNGKDYKVYEAIFGEEYTVVPTGNSDNVKKCVEACNLHPNKYSVQSAIGIIDSDLMSSVRINKLKANHIYAARCNEVEMLLIDELVFNAVMKKTGKGEVLFDSFKADFFCKLEEKHQEVVRRLVKTQIDEMLHRSNIDDKHNETKEKLKNNLEEIFKRIDFDLLWEDCETRVKEIIDDKNYEYALRYCCLEHGEVNPTLCNKYMPNYIDVALDIMRNSSDLREAIRGKYFPEI